jgi:uncharacterized protein YkvS
MQLLGFLILHLENLGALKALFKYFHTIALCCPNNTAEFQQAFHTVVHRVDTNQLIFHVLIFSTFLELDMQVIHKNSLPFNYPRLPLSTIQNL